MMTLPEIREYAEEFLEQPPRSPNERVAKANKKQEDFMRGVLTLVTFLEGCQNLAKRFELS